MAVEKIFPAENRFCKHSEALGGISRIDFQMDVAALPHAKLVRAIELLGTRVALILRAGLKISAQYCWY